MAGVSEAPWDGSPSRWPDTRSYCKSCLINDNTGPAKGWTQDKCHLPIKTPAGALSRAGVASATARFNQVKASPAAKAEAKRKLRAAHTALDMPVPDMLKG